MPAGDGLSSLVPLATSGQAVHLYLGPNSNSSASGPPTTVTNPKHLPSLDESTFRILAKSFVVASYSREIQVVAVAYWVVTRFWYGNNGAKHKVLTVNGLADWEMLEIAAVADLPTAGS